MITLDIDNIRTKSLTYKLKKYTEILKGINYYIAGGAIRDVFSLGYFTSDIDIFFPNRIEAAKAIKAFRKNRATIGFHNKQLVNVYLNEQKIQIVKAYLYSNTKELIDDFDFTVCSACYDGNKFYLHDNFFEDLAAKRLVINSLRLPLNTMKRVIKYVHKGFHICDGNLLTLAKAIATIDFNSSTQNVMEFYPDGTPKFKSID
jgi:hypothetical protein